MIDYVRTNAKAFGGDLNRITLAGQSSGAGLIKTLLTIPSASQLFQRVILQSAPLNYGDHSIQTGDRIGQAALSIFNSTVEDLRTKVSVSRILSVQDSLQQTLPTQIPEIASSEVFKPVIDRSLITSDFLTAINQPHRFDFLHNHALIFTTVKDEAGPTISTTLEPNTSYHSFEPVLEASVASLDTYRIGFIKSSGIYSKELNVMLSQNKPDATRDELTVFGTDYVSESKNIFFFFFDFLSYLSSNRFLVF